MSQLNYITEHMFRSDIVAEVDGALKLVGSICDQCGDTRFPAAAACPQCHAASDALSPMVLSDHGHVKTCCRIDRAPKSFNAPYLVGYVQLPEGPRILCQIEADTLTPGEIIGRSCTLVVGPLFVRGETPVLGYKFKVSA